MAQRNRRRQRRRGGARSKLLFVGAGLFVAVALAGIAVASWVLDVAAEAPSLAACKKIDRGGNSAIFAADGSKLGLIDSDEARAPVAIQRIPKQLQLATVAIEDQRFYEHGGIDPEGIARAALKNLEAGKTVEGGSTITQQLVRNLCIRNPKRNLERKIIEAQLAIKYAERHSRQEILDQYLNTASYGTVEGATAVGVGAASKIYFSKPVWKLKLGQAALLAGLPQAPSEYNPILHPRQARERRNAVLAKMAHLGYVSPARAKELEQRGLGLDVSGSYFAHREPFFFDYVENELIERYGVDAVRKGGLRVHTTLDPRLQEVGLEAMHSALPYSTDPSSALVSIDPGNGEIEAMVSSSSYDSSQFNLAAQGHRQPGSTFKAFVLTTAIKQGIDPYSTYYTSKPLDLNLPKWGHWEVHTADEGYLGRVNLQQATVASDNTVFAQLDLDVGPQRVAETAHSMGITSPLDGIPAEGIGGLRVGVSPLEMADAYATLASGGIHHAPVSIRRVEFPGGRVERPDREPPKRVISEAVAHEVTRLLHDNITEGTGTAAYTGCPGQAGKTGTTDRETDAWFAGYQPNLTSVVWVGYPQSNAIEMTSVHGITVFGGTFPAEIWNSLYSGAEVPCEEFSEPKTPISWAPYFGHFSAPAPRSGGSSAAGDSEESAETRRLGEEATGGYNPDAYAPRGGAGTDAGATATAFRAGRRRRGGGRSRERIALSLAPGVAYALIWAGFLAYLAALGWAPRLGRRLVWGTIVLLVAAFACLPPLLSHDVYSYVDYARLGVLHGLDPYVHAPSAAPADPAFAHVTWTETTSAYGPLFTLATYPLAWVPVGVALYVLKAISAAAVLATAALVARLAPARGVDPLRAAAFVALNPLVLVHAVGGPHNDALAVLLMTLGVASILAARETAGGAWLIAAIAVKASTAVVTPFALLGAANRGPTGLRRDISTRFRPVGRMLVGAAVATVVIGGGAYLGFGWHWLDAFTLAGENQDRTSHLSLPITTARLTGLDPGAVRAAAIALYAAFVVYLLTWTYRGGDWLRAAAWATFGLLLATAWLLPWYLLWPVPLAALSRDRLLQLLLLALTAYQLGARIPL